MRDKYKEALIIMSELLLEINSSAELNRNLLKIREDEIKQLKAKLDSIENCKKSE